MITGLQVKQPKKVNAKICLYLLITMIQLIVSHFILCQIVFDAI